MDETKRGYREAEETTKEAWRKRDGEDLADKVGNLGDDIRKGLGNAGDDIRRGAAGAEADVRRKADETKYETDEHMHREADDRAARTSDTGQPW